MVGNIAAQIALLTFAMALLAGLHAGNTATTILSRALVALLVAWCGAQFVAWVARTVLRDHLQRKKITIDREHFAAKAASLEAAAAAAAPADAGETQPAHE